MWNQRPSKKWTKRSGKNGDVPSYTHRTARVRKMVYCGLPTPPQIFGGSPGTGFFGSSGSFVMGGRKTVSRSFFFARPLPFNFSAIGFQHSAQMSYFLPRSAFADTPSLGRTGRRESSKTSGRLLSFAPPPIAVFAKRRGDLGLVQNTAR